MVGTETRHGEYNLFPFYQRIENFFYVLILGLTSTYAPSAKIKKENTWPRGSLPLCVLLFQVRPERRSSKPWTDYTQNLSVLFKSVYFYRTAQKFLSKEAGWKIALISVRFVFVQEIVFVLPYHWNIWHRPSTSNKTKKFVLICLSRRIDISATDEI